MLEIPPILKQTSDLNLFAQLVSGEKLVKAALVNNIIFSKSKTTFLLES